MPDNTKVKLVIKTHDNRTVKISMDALWKKLGIQHEPDQIWLEVSQNDTQMTAAVSPKEQDYPGITVDARDEHGSEIYLGGFELPNTDYPNSITARLYAGYADAETAEPICLVRHSIRKDKHPSQPVNPNHLPHKMVYVDQKLAESETWSTCGEERLPEHREDKI